VKTLVTLIFLLCVKQVLHLLNAFTLLFDFFLWENSLGL
jgi:hypothetical protein